MSESSNRHDVNSKRRRLLAALGGSASVGLAGCSAIFGGDDDEGDDDGSGDDGSGDDGGMDDGSGDDGSGDDGSGDDGSGDDGMDDGDSDMTHADKAQAAWERIVSNPGPDSQELRNEAYVEIEEAVRDDMVMINFAHDIAESMWYDRVNLERRSGTLGMSYHQHITTSVEGQDNIRMINSTNDSLDPITSDDEASANVLNKTYDKLTHYPAGIPELENQLLDSFELSDDGLTYTLNLKEGVMFHNGDELTAADVKYSMRRLAEADKSVRAEFVFEAPNGLGVEHETETVTNDNGEEVEQVVPDSLALEVVDDYTLEMTTANPNPAVLDVLTYQAFGVVPEGLVGDIEGYEGEVEQSVIASEESFGTGPWVLDSWQPNEQLVLTRNDDYYRDTPQQSEFVYTITEEAEARYTLVQEENVDIFGIPTQYYDPALATVESTDDRGRGVGTYGALENGKTVNYQKLTALVTRYFGFNVANTDRPVRKAIAYVLGQTEINEQVFKGRKVPAYSFTPPAIWPTGQDGYEQWVNEWPYGTDEDPGASNVEAARSLLEENGYTSDDPASLTVTTYASPTYQQAASIIRDKLSGAGVEFELEEAQFSTLIQRGYDGDLQMYSLGWGWSWESVAYGHFGFEPKNTDTSGMPQENNGYYLDWHVNLSENQGE